VAFACAVGSDLEMRGGGVKRISSA
jgi:hypothetical protein